MEIRPLPEGGLLIARVFDSSPASRAGLKPGEVIVGVNGRKLHGVDPVKATTLIKGRPGTDVQLQVESRQGAASPHEDA